MIDYIINALNIKNRKKRITYIFDSSCKLFNCSEVTSRYNTIKYDDLKILKPLSKKNRITIKSDVY